MCGFGVSRNSFLPISCLNRFLHRIFRSVGVALYPTATCFLFRSAGPFLFLYRLFCPAVSDASAKNWQECTAPLAGNTVPIKTEVISLKDKSFKRVLWLSPSERWRFCSAKPAPIPQERMLSLCESHGHKNGISTQIFAKRNISQLKLALDLNMNQNSISRYENREREADYDTLIRFADYFDVSLDYLLGRTDEKKRNRFKSA